MKIIFYAIYADHHHMSFYYFFFGNKKVKLYILITKKHNSKQTKHYSFNQNNDR